MTLFSRVGMEIMLGILSRFEKASGFGLKIIMKDVLTDGR